MAYNDWLSINPTSGTGNGTVSATISSHSGYLTRSKNVKISANINGEAKGEVLTFIQSGESINGTPVIRIDGAVSTRFENPLVETDLTTKSKFQFDIEQTNARDFQYFVEVLEGNIHPSELTGILSEPALVNTKITDVKTGNIVSLTKLKVTDVSKPGELKTVYSMDDTNLSKKYGENQTYSVHIEATPGTYTNRSSQPVMVKYGLAVLTGADSTTPVELTSFRVSYPAVTDFSVTGGGRVSSASSTQPIRITAPSDVTWNAQII